MHTASENILAGLRAQWEHLAALTPQAVALNLALSAGLLALCALFMWLAGRALCWSLRIVPGLGRAERKAHAATALSLTRSALNIVIVIGGAFAIAGVWGIDLLSWTTTLWGSNIATTATRLIIVIVASAIAMEATGVAMGYAVGRLRSRSNDDPRRAAQLDTLGPIVANAARTFILIIAVMTLLGQAGVQIAPLLASAGVAGVALGFGAQTLVKDFLTGFFLIVEDIVAIGDVVQIQAFSGTVEQMTLRTIRLRDFDGTLHIFPYGEAQIIHNLTKTYSFAAFDLPLRYDSDLDRVMQVMRDTAGELRQDRRFGPLMLDDIEIPGADLLSDVGIIIKARIRTQPRDRWLVFREYNRRIKHAFDEAGLVMTHK